MNKQIPSSMPWKQTMCKTCYTIWIDYFTAGPPHSLVCTDNIATMIAMCEELGFTINADKITKPATTTNLLGVDIDLVAMEAIIYSTCLPETISLLEGIVGHQSSI